MEGKIIWLLCALLLFSQMALANELNIKTSESQNVSGSVITTSDGFARDYSGPASDGIVSWLQALVNFLKHLVGLQSVQPQDFGVSYSASHNWYIGTVAKIGESPPVLGPDHPSNDLNNLLYTQIDYWEKSTNTIQTCTDCAFGTQLDFRNPASGGSVTSLVSKGMPKIKQVAGGYVTINEATNTATWHANTGVSHADEENYVARYEFTIDRAGFGVEFSDPRNLIKRRDGNISIPLTFTNNIAGGILCSAEITIKNTGFYTGDIKQILPAQKCAIGTNTLNFNMDVSQIGTAQVSALALIIQPSFTKFSSSGRLTECGRKGNVCSYSLGNETIIDDFTITKNYEIAPESSFATSSTAEVFKTIQ